MSADNAIYIRPMPGGKFAVLEISSFYTDGMTDEQIDKEFQHAPKFDTLEEAWEEDERIQETAEENGWYIEYGTEVLHRKTSKPK